jgi:hypothetical protein
MQGLQVEDGEEVDGFELAVDGGLAADLGADGEVGAEQLGGAGSAIQGRRDS